MAVLFLVLGLSILLGIFSAVIKLFFSQVIFFEASLLFIASIFVGIIQFSLHPVYSVLFSLGIFMIVFLLWNTKVGFWLLSIPFSVGWGFLAGSITHAITEGDMIWSVFAGVVSLVIVFSLHINAMPKPQNNGHAEIAVSKDNLPQG